MGHRLDRAREVLGDTRLPAFRGALRQDEERRGRKTAETVGVELSGEAGPWIDTPAGRAHSHRTHILVGHGLRHSRHVRQPSPFRVRQHRRLQVHRQCDWNRLGGEAFQGQQEWPARTMPTVDDGWFCPVPRRQVRTRIPIGDHRTVRRRMPETARCVLRQIDEARFVEPSRAHEFLPGPERIIDGAHQAMCRETRSDLGAKRVCVVCAGRSGNEVAARTPSIREVANCERRAVTPGPESLDELDPPGRVLLKPLLRIFAQQGMVLEKVRKGIELEREERRLRAHGDRGVWGLRSRDAVRFKAGGGLDNDPRLVSRSFRACRARQFRPHSGVDWSSPSRRGPPHGTSAVERVLFHRSPRRARRRTLCPA